MLPKDVGFEKRLEKFIVNGFKLRDFPQDLYEETIKRFELKEDMAYESFFSSFFTGISTQLKFIRLCQHYGYGPFSKTEDKLMRILIDLTDLRKIQEAQFPNQTEL